MSESTTRQTIHQARRLHTQALNSERQANVYLELATYMTDKAGTTINTLEVGILTSESDRLLGLYDELMADHDHLLGQIDPEWIDYL